MGKGVEPEEIGAKFENGILEISVPKETKKPEVKSTSISIQ